MQNGAVGLATGYCEALRLTRARRWVPRALYPGIKRPVREADHSPQTNAEVKKTRTYTSTPSYVFMVKLYLVKHGEKFTLVLGLTSLV
jgi:hypothetical protein